MVMQCLNFFQQVDSNAKIQENLTGINILGIVKGCVFEVDLEYPKEF